MNSSSGAASYSIILIILAVVMFVGYWIPTIVAHQRKVTNFGSIVIINLFAGWTFVGWVVALAMACRDRKPKLA